MIPIIVIFIYLVIVTVIGSVAYRKAQANTEDFFLASRTVGGLVFFLSLFATNMTAFAILGSSGQAYRQGIGIFGLMATSSCFVIPLTIFFIGTRLWAVGKKFGHQTQVAFFRDRWECDCIGTVIFVLTIVMLVPYMIISIMGGGRVLADISGGHVTYWFGCGVVAVTVTLAVFFGGMRGTVWVNIFQTILFLAFGLIAVVLISSHLEGGFGQLIAKIAGDDKTRALLTRERMSERYFWSYTLIPLSSIMFPHMAIMCFSAKQVTTFRRTVVAYPLAIMAVWLPCVFLGVIGTQIIPGLQGSAADGVLLRLLEKFAPVWLAGILGAGIISVVMGSDAHQVLAVSTMFTKDIFGHYGGKERWGERGSVFFARAFIIVVTVIAYVIALYTPESIFELAVRFAFSGFAAMAPVMIAALFWKRSTKWGALASTVWVAACLLGSWWLQSYSEPIVPKTVGQLQAALKDPKIKDAAIPPLQARMDKLKLSGTPIEPPAPICPAIGLERTVPSITFFGFLPVVVMVLGSALVMILGSLFTRPPSHSTIEKYFPNRS